MSLPAGKIQCGRCGTDAESDSVICVQCKTVFHFECADDDDAVFDSTLAWRCERCQAGQPKSPARTTEDAAASGSMTEHPAPRASTGRSPPGSEHQQEPLGRWEREPLTTAASTEPAKDVGRYATSEELAKMQAKYEVMMDMMARVSAQRGASPGRHHPCSTAYDSLESHELSRSQVSARHAVARELPAFSGKVEEWPLFLATYEETTRICNFSASENVLRLRQALSGKALKAVQCRLRRAEDLPEAMATLREMYGRPEFLIDSLLSQIRRTPPPREDRLETLVDFAIAVEEICATVRSHDVDHRFDGPVLRELVDMLPWAIKIDWGRTCLTIPRKTLQEFGSFMRTLKNALLHVVSPSSSSSGEKRSTRHVNVHTTEDQEPAKPRRGACPCEEGCSSPSDCWQFWSMAIPERWSYVRGNGLCKSCLRSHRGQCRDLKQCGRDGCTAKHHRALHSDQPTPTSQPSPSKSMPPAEASPATSEHRGHFGVPAVDSKPVHHHFAGTNEVLLRYVPVKLYGRGRCVEALACLDEGSAVTLMDHRLVDELGLTGSTKPLCLSWTGGQTREDPHSVEVDLVISGIGKEERHTLSSVRTVDNLALPAQMVEIKQLAGRYKHLQRVPVRSYRLSPPRLLIGIDHYRLSRPLKTVEGAPHEPVATKTRVGWVVSGICGPRSDDGTKFSIVGHHALLRPCHDLPQPQSAHEITEEERSHTAAAVDVRVPLYQPVRFSRWWRLVRTAAFVRRFIHNVRNSSSRRNGPFQPSENDVISDAQQQASLEAYRTLDTTGTTGGSHVLNKSILLQRSPYLDDDDGLIQQKGHIDACSSATPSAKCPIIQPKAGHVTKLVVDLYHRLPELETVSIPRCYRQSLGVSGCEVQLHVFVDAGRDGLAAVAYFRFEASGQVEVALICGKTNVAPLKYTSVPRTELQASTVGTRLAEVIAEAHREPIEERFFWSDSRDVLFWINSDHRRYSTFVAQRVGKILDASKPEEWHWVPTQLNVADEGTKWYKLQNHLSTSSWFNGSAFLKMPTDDWPQPQPVPEATDEERVHTVAVHDVREPLYEPDRFSRWWRLVRTAAFVRRFIHNARNSSSRRTGPFQPAEVEQAESEVISDAQQQAFPEEDRALSLSKSTAGGSRVLTQSALLQRSLYLDDDGLIRHKGRIDACAYATPGAKRRIILLKGGRVSELVVDHYQRRYQHANQQTVMNESRQRYDIPTLRSACHRVRKSCAYCKIRDARPQPPLMGELQAGRISPYARPFTCLTTRAFHLEVAHSSTTSACFPSTRNFVGRRGTPSENFSDQGTNLVGAHRELKESWDVVSKDTVIEGSGQPYTTWHFIPPSGPHFDGAWKRMVQAAKRTLETIRMTDRPPDAVLQCWLIEVESIANSRPLMDLPVDRDEEAPLTPNHFLLGSSAGTKPLTLLDDTSRFLRNSWTASQSVEKAGCGRTGHPALTFSCDDWSSHAGRCEL